MSSMRNKSTLAVFKHTALSLVVVGTLYSTSLYAQEIELNLPSQPLQQSIQQLARQSNVDILYFSENLKNKTAPQIKGKVSVEQALHQLLQGTNLTLQKNGDVWSIVETPKNNQPVASKDMTQLPVIVVTATAKEENESKNNYGVNRSSSATKLDLSLKEIPQSISIITQKQIEEQSLTDVNKVLEATPGVTIQNYGVPGAGRVTFYSRGYEINNVMVDGNPTLLGGLRGMEQLAGYDTVIYDRVEVTRGSTGLSSGTGDPSASINIIRKRPTLEAERNAKLSWGTWGKKRAELDISQPFTSDGDIRGRFVAAYTQGGSYIERLEEESKIFYGIVEADLGDKTTLALGGTWFDKDIDDASPHGTSATNYVNPKVTSGIFDGGRKWNAATDWSYAQQHSWNGFINLDHTFNDNWKLSTNYQYSESKPDRKWGIFGADWYNDQVKVGSYEYGREILDSKIHNLDIGLLGKFELFGREAQLATGISGYQSKMFYPIYGSGGLIPDYIVDDYDGCSTTGCIRLNDWNNGHVTQPWTDDPFSILLGGKYPLEEYKFYNNFKEKQYGYYLSTKFEPLEKLKVILGARYNHYKMEQKLDTTIELIKAMYKDKIFLNQPDDKWIPYAGLIYDINDQLSVYASYTGIYKIQTEKDMYDAFLIPKEGNSYELGLKSALLDDKLNLATAIFRMQEKNTAYGWGEPPRNPETGDYYRCTPTMGQESCEVTYAADGPTITGFELTAQGQLNPKWMVNAGYTYLHVDQPKPEVGYSMSSVNSNGLYSFERPKHAINLSTSYQVTNDLTLGGSVRWKSRTEQSYGHDYLIIDPRNQKNNEILSQGHYAVFDVMARYKINEHMIAGLNINNLFDKEYRLNDAASLYGTPRSATFSMNFKF